jgi:excisionase family DNA binding protein
MGLPDAPRSFVRSAAIVEGWPALVIATLLDRPENCEYLEVFPPQGRQVLEDVVDAIRLAGRQWADEVRRGTSELTAAEQLPNSEEMKETMTTAQAADALGYSDRYIRRLIDAGALPAHRDSGGWQIDASAVLARREARP